MRVGSGIGGLPMRTQVGLDLDDPPSNGELPLFDPSDKQFAEQKPRHTLRRRLEEGAEQQLSRRPDSLASPHALRLKQLPRLPDSLR
jgi:hypothetical protein